MMSEGSKEPSSSGNQCEVIRACANCENYDWSQPADLGKLMTCSKCKFISYCSKECQLEHWVKVHKQHCKYLAGLKLLPQSRHDPAHCHTCERQAEIGEDQIVKATNPSLPCIFPTLITFVPVLCQPDHGNGNRTSANLPFQMGEMSGKFPTRAEQTISIICQLLYKMKLIKHPAWTILPEASKQLSSLLNCIKRLIWDFYIKIVPGHKLDITIQNMLTDNSSSPGLIKEVFAEVDKIDEKLAAVKFMDKSVYRPWDAVKLLLGVLYQFSFDYQRKDAERLAGEEMLRNVMCRNAFKLRVSSAQFSDMWSQLLETMTGKLVPYIDLVKITCEGQLNQVCCGCSKEIHVLEVFFNRRTEIECKKVVPFKFQGDVTACFCADVVCFDQVVGSRFWHTSNFIAHVYSKLSLDLSYHRCDHCFLPSKDSIHRCTGCLTKLYCGELCRDEDWGKVHSQVCKRGEKRKKKGGKQQRKEDVKTYIEEIVKQVEKMDPGDKEKEAMEWLFGRLLKGGD